MRLATPHSSAAVTAVAACCYCYYILLLLLHIAATTCSPPPRRLPTPLPAHIGIRSSTGAAGSPGLPPPPGAARAGIRSGFPNRTEGERRPGKQKVAAVGRLRKGERDGSVMRLRRAKGRCLQRAQRAEAEKHIVTGPISRLAAGAVRAEGARGGVVTNRRTRQRISCDSAKRRLLWSF